jgi:hypothetical protein
VTRKVVYVLVRFVRRCRKKKNLDLIVLNSLQDDAGFEKSTNKITL